MTTINHISGLLRRHLWGLLGILAIMCCVAACSETVVDDGSATIIKRKTDTLILRDTTTLLDTLIVADTLRTTDTLIRYDTIVNVVTIVKVDTLIKNDTLRLRDTISRVDTITRRDTVVRHDTIRDNRGRFSGEGWIFLRSKYSNAIIDSVPIVIDPASLLELQFYDTRPKSLQLRLTARAQRPGDWYLWGEKCTWFMYLLVDYASLPWPVTNLRKELNADPREEPSGLAIVPHAPLDTRWLSTGASGNEGTFWVNSIDVPTRCVYASFKARFSYPESVTIDSAALRLRY